MCHWFARRAEGVGFVSPFRAFALRTSRLRMQAVVSPVCVRMCRFSRLGRSKALPQTSHGSSARSPRCGRAFGEARGILVMVVSCRSPVLLAADDDDVDDSPDTDLCSSSVLDGGEMGSMTRDSSDMDRSSGDSARRKEKEEPLLLGRPGFFFSH